MGPSPRRRLSVMADVAKVTGVSHQAVSRVLNDHPDVSAEARTQVLRAIDQLGYRRDLVARALVTRNSRRLGVVSFDTTLYGIERVARDVGHLIGIASLRTIDRAEVLDAIDYLTEQGVNGTSWSPRRLTAEALGDMPTGMPVPGGGRRRWSARSPPCSWSTTGWRRACCGPSWNKE